MPPPRDILSASTHPDPYPWYAQLRAGPPVFLDPTLQLWIVTGAAAVREALQHPDLRVRPPSEPVPKALVGRPTGEVFAQLVRMTDGAFHATHKPTVRASAQRWSDAQVDAATQAAVADLAPRVPIDALLTAIPVQAMARLLGVATADLDATVDAVHAFTRGIAAGADAQAIAAADAAVVLLLAQGEREGLSSVASANRIAFMQQALDATAGLIGNAIAGWRTHPRDLAGTAFVEAIARHDPAIHHTRRFAARDLTLGGQAIAAGQGLVVVLVAPEAHLGFGHGPHACPGERIALHIAAAALRGLQAAGVLDTFGPVQAYRPLPNARIPVFSAAAPAR